MSPINTPKHEIITRITFGAFALSLFALGCDPADEPIGDDELLAADEEEEDAIDELAATPSDDEPSDDEPSDDEPEATPIDELPTPAARVLDFGLTAAVDVIGYAWTGMWFSEETPASLCPPNSVNTGVMCSGRYCDNMQLECNPATVTGSGTWTTWFSEEGTNYRTCEGNKYVTGMQCSGWWCDNLALYCSPTNTTPTNNQCVWSGYFSEEDPIFFAPVGTAIKGVQCSGPYCDNKRYMYCSI